MVYQDHCNSFRIIVSGTVFVRQPLHCCLASLVSDFHCKCVKILDMKFKSTNTSIIIMLESLHVCTDCRLNMHAHVSAWWQIASRAFQGEAEAANDAVVSLHSREVMRKNR